MIELIRAAAERAPEQAAVITNDSAITYAGLLAAAENVANALRERDITRFAIADVDAVVVLALLAGASAAGADACIYPPLETGDEAAELAERFDHGTLVSADEVTGDFELLTASELIDASSAASTGPGKPPDERPLLILTTGTTGAPKGVRHDWARVMRAVAHVHPTPDQRWLLAYGLHQFAGLQILVHVTAAQATLVAPAPRRPREGLAAMRAHAVDHASATPTFWRFVLAEMRSDDGPVPALRQITLGGEAVPAQVLDDLRTVFPEARISQIYAANEAGSSRSVRDNRPGLPIDALSEDEDELIAHKILDGQLWVRSKIGMLGYYGEPPIDPDAWRPTGDLVEVVNDRVVFRGRASDIINVGGVKVHPLPIEDRITSVGGVELARVFGRPNALTGAIVAVDVVPTAGADTEAVDAAIRDVCADLPAAHRPRSVRFVQSLAMTGNKINRRVTADAG